MMDVMNVNFSVRVNVMIVNLEYVMHVKYKDGCLM